MVTETAESPGSDACTVTRAPFGAIDGREVEAITLAAPGGMAARILTFGATLQAVLAPDRDAVFVDVALGHATLAEYLDHPQYLGSTVGRVANRIAGGRFMLDGKEFRVPLNNGPNSLHGGARGFDAAIWTVLATSEGESASVTLGHVSPDSDQGYPGRLTVTACYSLANDGALSVEYRAATDRPTVVNLSNHAYWNLAGEGAPGGAMNQLLTIFAEHYLPTDETAIPTGEIRAVAGGAFDFREPRVVADRVRDASDEQIRIGRGFDHNWVLAREACDKPRPVARVEDPASGRIMELLSNQPGLQFYSGNFLDAKTAGKHGQLYRMGDAIALEPQAFPDTPNQPDFGSIRLDPGQSYRNIIVWRFSAR